MSIANAVAINGTGGVIDNNNHNLTLFGDITNGNATTGSLTVEDTTGNGNLFLSGANTYSGPTNITTTGSGMCRSVDDCPFAELCFCGEWRPEPWCLQ